ncbi:MAG TPA: serine hydrolase domain-containing protein [Burkholderiales bacterium]|jgi:CubicO group peptidase (beta-lactamase class C family)|nr:serine hydrolase domain-containing protein [Burkholderiales bacterium]
MKPYWAAAALVVSFTALAQTAPPLPSAPPESVGMSSQRLARISAALKKEVADGSFRGAVVMVARKGKLVYQDAVGMQTADAPMRPDTVFRIYSMTKPLVSVAAMILVEDGRIQLTDPVGKFLQGFDKMQVSVASKAAEGTAYNMVAAERPMTVQDLLRHTAGLAYGEITQNAPVKEGLEKAGVYRKDLDYEARGMTASEQVERLVKVPLAFHPGTTWHYSLASDVLGRVIEAASGKRLGEFLQERLFRPLRMRDTGFSVPQAKMARLAEPLETDRFSGRPNKLIDVSAPPANDSGGAGAVSTAGDYLRFSQMLLNGGALDGARVMSRTTVRLMTSDHLGNFINQPQQPGELLLGTKGYTFGLGFAVRQGDGVGGVPGSAGEFMWAGYAGTYFFVDPKEQLTAVLMTQAPSPNRAYFRRMLKQLVYQSIVD